MPQQGDLGIGTKKERSSGGEERHKEAVALAEKRRHKEALQKPRY